MVPVQWAAVASCSGRLDGSGSSSVLGVRGFEIGRLDRAVAPKAQAAESWSQSWCIDVQGTVGLTHVVSAEEPYVLSEVCGGHESAGSDLHPSEMQRRRDIAWLPDGV